MVASPFDVANRNTGAGDSVSLHPTTTIFAGRMSGDPPFPVRWEG